MKLNINPNAQRAALWLIVAFAVIILVNYAIKTIAKIKANAASNQANAVNTVALSADLKQYSIWADTLETNIGPWTTDESAVYAVMSKMKNNDDLKQLIKAFGSRTYTYIIGKLTLPAYITAGMSSDEIEKVNETLNNNGVTIQF